MDRIPPPKLQEVYLHFPDFYVLLLKKGYNTVALSQLFRDMLLWYNSKWPFLGGFSNGKFSNRSLNIWYVYSVLQWIKYKYNTFMQFASHCIMFLCPNFFLKLEFCNHAGIHISSYTTYTYNLTSGDWITHFAMYAVRHYWSCIMLRINLARLNKKSTLSLSDLCKNKSITVNE